MGIRRVLGRVYRLLRKSTPIPRYTLRWERSLTRLPSGNSTSADTLSAPPAKTAAQRWASLSTGAKIAIYSSIGAVAAILIALLALYCIKQRRAGLRERAIADANYEKETAELLAFRAQGTKGWERI